MQHLLQLFVIIPLAGFLLSFLPQKKDERTISMLTLSVIGIHLLGIMFFAVYWLLQGFQVLDIRHATLYRTADIEIFIDFYFDRTTAVYAVTGSLIAFAVAQFSKTYMHREEGYKRYFSTLLLFFTGYNILIFSGNFETLFTGWELIGITSFLLISFYRDRYLPVKNALKVISVYRISDICLILAMWMSHHLWHENITFFKLNDASLVAEHLLEHQWFGVFIAVMIVIAAAVKSAQLPFSSWLPRAMEGPTTSSAIFYGSLSVHGGVFLLIRTYPYWESILAVKILIILIGVSTAIIATFIGRVQPTVKTQIAYSSAAQIGLMFIEVALEFHTLALIHFAGNAFFRTYQLLVSPSVLSYFIHDMVFSFNPDDEKSSSSKIINTLYMLSVKEWNLDSFFYRYGWSSFKWLGNAVSFFTKKTMTVLLSIIFVLGLYCYYFQQNIPATINEYLPELFSLLGLILILRTFAERGDAIRAWAEIISSQMFLALAVGLLHEDFGHDLMLVYLGGSVVSAIVGYVCLKKIKTIDGNIELNRFHGYVYEKPGVALVFLLACLGLVGLPFTPTFIGIDLLFSHIHKYELITITFVTLCFLFMEISVLRIYARVFLGQHKKHYHPIAFKSS